MKNLYEFENFLNENNMDEKSDLIEVLTNKIKSMGKDPKFTATSLAQTVYNNCAHFMNKTDIFSSRPGQPLKTEAPFAPEV